MDCESQFWSSVCFKRYSYLHRNLSPYNMYFYWLKIYENTLFQMTTIPPTNVPQDHPTDCLCLGVLTCRGVIEACSNSKGLYLSGSPAELGAELVARPSGNSSTVCSQGKRLNLPCSHWPFNSTNDHDRVLGLACLSQAVISGSSTPPRLIDLFLSPDVPRQESAQFSLCPDLPHARLTEASLMSQAAQPCLRLFCIQSPFLLIFPSFSLTPF